MVFYVGRAPHGTKTTWKMNEYKAINIASSSSSPTTNPQLREEVSLCRIYKKSRSIRAFDRRPPSDAVAQDNHAAADHDDQTPEIANPFQSLEHENNQDTGGWDYDHFINSFNI